MKNDLSGNPLRWVMLLLAAAVILPTACLLWFMNQAMNNERLAVRSKLYGVYNSHIQRAFSPFLEWINTENRNAWAVLNQYDSIAAFDELAADPSDFPCQGLFVFDSAETPVYPCLSEDPPGPTDRKELQEAFHFEFTENRLQAAMEEYHRVENSTDQQELAQYCRLAQARILEKQGRPDQAIKICEQSLSLPAVSARYYAMTQMKYLVLLQQQGLADKERAEAFSDQLNRLFATIRDGRLLSPQFRIFVFENAVDLCQTQAEAFLQEAAPDLHRLERIMDLESQSLEFLDRHPNLRIGKATPRMVEKQDADGLYALNLFAGQKKAVRLIDAEQIIRSLSENLNIPGDVHYRIVTPDGQTVVGSPQPAQSPFLTIPIASFFDWTVEFYENQAQANAFEAAARHTITVYLWTGILVIGLVFLAGSMAIRAVGRQARLNRLKNDFIATVTHELKTPLSSTRLLVDTLLAQDCRDPCQTREYLELIARENHRLSRLIDNFLTFSRMERNKQAFEFSPADPAAMARSAAEAVQTKFTESGCRLSLEIPDALPRIRADYDAMVTVLINLLDNAWKYSDKNKPIDLRVFAENQEVCFAVKDNGIGISRRDRKKIFKRFYQVDNSLVRKSEGTGLGLSIVHYIVQAHRGRITVDSKSGAGSCFTVRLPMDSGERI